MLVERVEYRGEFYGVVRSDRPCPFDGCALEREHAHPLNLDGTPQVVTIDAADMPNVFP